MATAQVQSKPRMVRRRSEAEILSVEVAATTSFHIQHLNISESENNNTSKNTLGEKFVRSVSETACSDGEPTTPTTPTTSNKPLLQRRASLSILEESHLDKAMTSGAFLSEAEKSRKARKKSFDKLLRKKSDDEDRKVRKERKSSFKTIPDDT